MRKHCITSNLKTSSISIFNDDFNSHVSCETMIDEKDHLQVGHKFVQGVVIFSQMNEQVILLFEVVITL